MKNEAKIITAVVFIILGLIFVLMSQLMLGTIFLVLAVCLVLLWYIAQEVSTTSVQLLYFIMLLSAVFVVSMVIRVL